MTIWYEMLSTINYFLNLPQLNLALSVNGKKLTVSHSYDRKLSSNSP